MKTQSLGPREIDWNHEFERIARGDYGPALQAHVIPHGPPRWVVYWYDYDEAAYEGSGVAVLRFSDGRLATVNLDHCSCTSGVDDIAAWSFITPEALAPPESVLDVPIREDAVRAKALELWNEDEKEHDK